MLAVAVKVVWALTGPIFHWSDTWQLIVNTGTTVNTFLMVFLIQSTQNRDSVALQVKLDELLRVPSGAHNVLMDLEELEEQELERIRRLYVSLAAEARRGRDTGRSDEDGPEIGELVSKTTPAVKSQDSSRGAHLLAAVQAGRRGADCMT